MGWLDFNVFLVASCFIHNWPKFAEVTDIYGYIIDIFVLEPGL